MAYATGSTGLAITVRGSSRRIMIMRFRPANIRLINRRLNLPRLLLALSSGKSKNNDNDKNNPIDSARLTGSLHIRSLLQLLVNCWDSSGLLEPEQRRPSASELQPDRNKSKNFPNREKAKTFLDETRHPTRAQSQQQPEQARRRILAWPMRQARPDSR